MYVVSSRSPRVCKETLSQDKTKQKNNKKGRLEHLFKVRASERQGIAIKRTRAPSVYKILQQRITFVAKIIEDSGIF